MTETAELAQEPNLIEIAKSEREQLMKENERLEKNIRELRALEAQRLLSGTAGGRVEEPPKIETAKEYAEKIMRGELNQ